MTKHMMPKAPITALMEALKPAGVVGNPRSGGSDMTSILSELRNEIGRIGESQRGRMETIANRLETLEIRNQDLEQQLAASGRVIGSPVESWGAQVVNSTTFRSAAADGTHRFKINQAITSTGGSGGALIGRDTRTDPVQLARRRLTIRDLLNPGRTTSNMVEFGTPDDAHQQRGAYFRGCAKTGIRLRVGACGSARSHDRTLGSGFATGIRRCRHASSRH